MKKLFCVFLSVCVLAVSIVGCKSDNNEAPTSATTPEPSATTDEEKPAPSGEDLIFWGYWDGDVADQINEIVSAFNDKTGNNVQYVCQSDMMNAFQAAAISNDVPDIMLWDASEVRRYARMGQLLSIDDFIVSAGVPKTDFNDESIRELTVDDKLYGLPMNLDIWGLYVNMDILRAAGIEKAPSTWDEVKAAAVASMKVDGVKVGLNMKMAPYLFNSFYAANNGKPLSDDGSTVNLDDKALQVLEYFKELIDAGVYTTKYVAENGSDGFLSGEEAMCLWPTSMLRSYKTYGDQIDFTFMPIPKGRADGAKAGGTQTSWSLVIPATSEHAQVAQEFLTFALHDNENSLKWCDIVGGFSALKAVQNDEKFSNDKYLKNVIADLDNHQIRSDVPGFINLEGTCYGPEIEKLFEGTQTPQSALDVMKTEGDKLLAQYRGDN
jgi:multiple sugar transport system substrate-binding protein